MPLIVILFVTAVKDGIEDWRRTVLDNELNNAPVHRLVDFNNVNTAEDKISLWRKLKKATTRAITFAWRKWQGRKSSKKRNMKTYAETAMDQPRPSIDTRRTSVVSRSSRRTSYHSTRSQPGDDGIQMSPVPSPLPGQSPQKEEYLDIPGEPATTVSYEQVHAEPYEQASASKAQEGASRTA